MPQGRFEITTYVEFSPRSNFQSAGIIIFGGPQDSVRLTRAFCGICPGGDGVYLDRIDNGEIPTGDGGHRLPEPPDGVYLRLIVNGDTYSGSYSVDGSTWRSAGRTTKSMADPQIGLIMRPNDPVAPAAHFDFFEVTR